MTKFARSILSLAFLSAAVTGSPLALETLANMDFEQGELGGVPPGWLAPKWSLDKGYSIFVTGEGVHGGTRCVAISRSAAVGPPEPGAIGNVMKTIDARPYRGKRVRLRGAVRIDPAGVGDQAQLWLRVDRPGGARGFFDNMYDRPIRVRDWGVYEIVGEVAADAEAIAFGMFLLGNGTAWLDDVAFEAIGTVGEGDEGPAPLSTRALENLVTYTRLLGYVRYFHPSDEAAAVDWSRYAVDGVKVVEPAIGPAELARALDAWFRPVAPTVRVFASHGSKPPLSAALEPPAGSPSPKIVAWRHEGLGDGTPSGEAYTSLRGSADDAPAPVAELVRTIDAVALRGQRLRFRARVRIEPEGSASEASFGLVAFTADFARSASDGENRPITSREWHDFDASIEVAADAKTIDLVLGLKGGGKAWFDAVTLQPVDGAEPSGTVSVGAGAGAETFGFSGQPGDAPEGWVLAKSPRSSNFRVDRATGCSGGDAACLVLSGETAERKTTLPARVFEADLGGGVSCIVPLALYADAEGTLPRDAFHAETGLRPERPAGWQPSGNDRSTRLAAVAVAWNALQHFYPYFDVVETDWPGALRRALATAATDPDDEAFLGTLRRMVAELHDGHGNVYHASDPRVARLPILWDWIEDRLVVTWVGVGDVSGLRQGDVVVSIDGKPALEAIRAEEETVSGATPQWIRRHALQALVTGPADSAVRLEIAPGLPGASPGTQRSLTLKRNLPLHGDAAVRETRPPNLVPLRPGIYYMDVETTSNEEFERALPALSTAKGLIVDVRGYPSLDLTRLVAHLVEFPVTSPQWYVPLVSRPDRQDLEFLFSNWTVQPVSPRIGGKVVFLIDSRAISASETLLGIVEGWHLGERVGSATAGTNGNVNYTTLPGGYRVAWTGMKVLKHDGTRHHGIGILPTVPVARTISGVSLGRDEVLDRALSLMPEE